MSMQLPLAGSNIRSQLPNHLENAAMMTVNILLAWAYTCLAFVKVKKYLQAAASDAAKMLEPTSRRFNADKAWRVRKEQLLHRIAECQTTDSKATGFAAMTVAAR